VNFYVAQVYPGVLSEDAASLPDGVPLAIPLSRDTPADLKKAVAQFWQWSNWQSGNKLMVKFGAALGSVLTEIDDDAERGRIGARNRWPGHVKRLVLDNAGNVKSYVLEYDYEETDERGQKKTYTYRKEVDDRTFRFFRSDKPFDYGQGSSYSNPYGFCPAVWTKHTDAGSDFGDHCYAGAIAKIDELNSLASHVYDLVDRQIETPGIIATDGSVELLRESRTTTYAEDDRIAAGEASAVEQTRQRNSRVLMLKAPSGTAWHPMVSTLDPDKALPLITGILDELKEDFPELTMYHELRKQDRVTGPGAAQMNGDVVTRLLEVEANYDTQSIKLFQMAAAVGGFRYREGKGGWSARSAQQQKFEPFDLDSYRRGDLDMAIMPRLPFTMTETDAVELQGKRINNAVAAKEIIDPDGLLEIAGVPQEKRAKAIAFMEQRRAQAQLQLPPAPDGDGDDLPN
jgi:hypothetical protein